MLSALRKLCKTFPESLIEEDGFFSKGENAHGSLVESYCSSNVAGDVVVKGSGGNGNIMYRGFASRAKNLVLNISGSGNIVFFGAHTKINNTRINISGSDSIFFHWGIFNN